MPRPIEGSNVYMSIPQEVLAQRLRWNDFRSICRSWGFRSVVSTSRFEKGVESITLDLILSADAPIIEASVGDWLIREGDTFKVMSDEEFNKQFESAPDQ